MNTGFEEDFSYDNFIRTAIGEHDDSATDPNELNLEMSPHDNSKRDSHPYDILKKQEDSHPYDNVHKDKDTAPYANSGFKTSNPYSNTAVGQGSSTDYANFNPPAFSSFKDD